MRLRRPGCLKKASDRLITFDGLKVAVLGLTFKPGTDDLREAPSLGKRAPVIERGADIIAYDPVGEDNFKKRYPEEDDRFKGSITYVIQPKLWKGPTCASFIPNGLR